MNRYAVFKRRLHPRSGPEAYRQVEAFATSDLAAPGATDTEGSQMYFAVASRSWKKQRLRRYQLQRTSNVRPIMVEDTVQLHTATGKQSLRLLVEEDDAFALAPLLLTPGEK